MEQRMDLKSMPLQALQDLMKQWGQPAFRAKQIFGWLHEKQVTSVDEMNNLPLSLREKLKEQCDLTVLTTERKLVSSVDQTTKYLFRLPDGEHVETVLMHYSYGKSICISTQVGCKMGCAFCASTKAGFVRHLTAGEMLEQIYSVQRDQKEAVSHVVLMGIGEPLDNFNEVITFLLLLNSPFGANMSTRRISLSTCGLVPQMDALAEHRLGLTLSVSLHAADDATRDRLMPVNRRFPLKELMAACTRYTQKTGRRISFEYALIRGENDNDETANRLAALLKGQLCHVNLIPVNPVKETDFQSSDRRSVQRFAELLQAKGIPTTVRRTLGSDIAAACGQLRREQIEQQNP